MGPFTSITLHESQWPDRLARQLREGLESRRIAPKYHYESARQVRKWLRLHESVSPARQDPGVLGSYEAAFEATATELGSTPVHLVALGCGGGRKEARLLERLRPATRNIHFTPVDVGTAVLIATLRATQAIVRPEHCSPLVCDLNEADAVAAFLDQRHEEPTTRLVTFFGMIPSFEPGSTVRVLDRLVRSGDFLLTSANLAPGRDYESGVQRVLPQYENELTRDWLMTLLRDLGAEPTSGGLEFSLERCPTHAWLLRIEANFLFRRETTLFVEREPIRFKQGEKLLTFFSYRHTFATLARLLADLTLERLGAWPSDSGEEAVILYRRV